MKDYLTRLVELNRGEAEVVSPRLPGLYAPLPDTGLEPSGEADLTQVRAAESPGETPGSPLVQAPAMEEQQPSPVPGPQDRFPEEGLERPGADMQQKPAMPAEPAGLRGDSPLVTTPETPVLQEMDIPWRRHAGKRAAPGPEKDSEKADPRRADQGVGPAGTGSIHSAAGSASRRREAAYSSQSQPPAPLVRARTGSLEERAQTPMNLPSATETRAGAEPSIHVTIGRVEVRANTVPPKPAPRPVASRAQDGLSLQDYLKRGGGRGGRS